MKLVKLDLILISLVALPFPGFNLPYAWGAGFDVEYEAYVGDYDNDGDTDVLIATDPRIVILHGSIALPIETKPVPDFVLQSDSPTGELAILQGKPPNISGWVPSSANLAALDFNSDGYEDLFVREISNEISGVDDHVVYAAQGRSRPETLTRLTPEIHEFFDDVSGFIEDRSYFNTDLLYSAGVPYGNGYMRLSRVLGNPNNLPSNTFVSGVDPFNENVEPHEDCDTEPNLCEWDPYYGWYVYIGTVIGPVVYSVPVYNYDSYLPGSIFLASQITSVENGDDTLGPMDNLTDLFEIILGAVIGGDPSITGPAVVYSPDYSEDWWERNAVFNRILTVWLASFQERLPEPRVHVRTRRVDRFFEFIHHASIHYPGVWYSAFPSNGPVDAFFDNAGAVESDRSSLEDRPGVTLRVGSVPDAVAPIVTWGGIVGSAERYDNDVPYCLFPEVNRAGVGECDVPGYNSNSYVKGLMESVTLLPLEEDVGAPPWTTTYHPGVGKPIPASEF